MTKISKLIIVFILCFLTSIVVAQKRIVNCVDLDAPPALIENSSHRNLQAIIKPHGFRINFLQPPSDPAVNPTDMLNMFGVAAFFFKQLLKVTDVTDTTKYTRSYNCGSITPTSIYATEGFSFQKSDMVISTQLTNSNNVTYVAYASSCIVRSWPQYGLIGFNLAYFSPNPTYTAKFQENLATLVFI